jgi:predicted LPLAT superfamily acyltransferase
LSILWQQQRERSSPRTIALMVWIALHLGRKVTRTLLWPIAIYFFLTGPDARRASRRFLQRAGTHSHGTAGVLRHFYTFACCALDRVFLLSGRYRGIRVTVHASPELLHQIDTGGARLIPTSHIGSYEILRVLGSDLKNLRFRIVMDRQHGSMTVSVLEGLNPDLAQEIIDGGSRGPTLALALKEALNRGCVVGLMADRLTPRDRGMTVDFLGSPVQLPDSPWRLAAVLGTPVALCFGLYLGEDRYELHFEHFLDGGSTIPHAQRAAFVEQCVRRYVSRLEHYARLAPYNWFNFYDYWGDARTGDH